MRVFFHFGSTGFSNTYIIGPHNGGDAIIIDPGVMDLEMLDIIESNNYYIRSILLTTLHEHHLQGLDTILKIYKADIYSGAAALMDRWCLQVHDNDTFTLGDFKITVFNISGHSSENVVYRIEDMLFTGDALGAGTVGDSPNSYAREILASTIQDKIAPLEDHLIILPGHGPPSTLEAERKFNPVFREILS